MGVRPLSQYQSKFSALLLFYLLPQGGIMQHEGRCQMWCHALGIPSLQTPKPNLIFISDSGILL